MHAPALVAIAAPTPVLLCPQIGRLEVLRIHTRNMKLDDDVDLEVRPCCCILETDTRRNTCLEQCKADWFGSASAGPRMGSHCPPCHTNHAMTDCHHAQHFANHGVPFLRLLSRRPSPATLTATWVLTWRRCARRPRCRWAAHRVAGIWRHGNIGLSSRATCGLGPARR